MRGHPRLLASVITSLALTGQIHAQRTRQTETAPAIRDAAEAVRFDLYQGYCIVVHGSAGPLKNLNFIVDTGTNLTTFNSLIAKKLDLRDEAPTDVVVVTGRERAENATLPWLKFGPVERFNLEINVADLSLFQKYLPVPIDAIIGLDVLGQRPFDIDYPARVIRFGLTAVLPVTIPLRFDGGLAIFDAEIDHRLVHLLFDTGAPSLILYKTGNSPDSGVNNATGRGGDKLEEFKSTRVLLDSLKVGPEEFRHEPAVVAGNAKSSRLDFDGLMSPAALGISRVSIDLRGGVLGFGR